MVRFVATNMRFLKTVVGWMSAFWFENLVIGRCVFICFVIVIFADLWKELKDMIFCNTKPFTQGSRVYGLMDGLV